MKKILLLLMLTMSIGMDAQELQSSIHSCVGYITADGEIQNSSHSTIGYVTSRGEVQNKSHSTIGYVKNIPMRWAALYFFFQ